MDASTLTDALSHRSIAHRPGDAPVPALQDPGVRRVREHHLHAHTGGNDKEKRKEIASINTQNLKLKRSKKKKLWRE